jgi:P pilus assembly chaperone PapD
VRRTALAAVGIAASAVAAANAAGPDLSVSVSPTIVTIAGKSSAPIDVSNPTDQSVTVDVSLANYAIESDGTVLVDPKEPPNRTAKAWISVRPQVLKLGPNAHGQVIVTSHPPAHAEAGDHHALVLLATPPGKGGQVAVRTQVGVGVLVRMPGKIERKLAITRLHARRLAKGASFSLTLANRGNVNEFMEPGRVTLQLEQGGKTVATLVTPGYDLLPHSSVTRTVAFHHRLHGTVTVVATVRPVPAAKDGPGITQQLAPLHATFVSRL